MVIQMDGATKSIGNLRYLITQIHYYDDCRDEGKGYAYTIPYSCPSSHTQGHVLLPLSYLLKRD